MKWLSAYLASEWKKISALSGRAKAEYIWQYYKLWIIGIVAGVSLLVFTVYRVATVPTENWLYAMFVNTHAEVGNGSAFWDGFVDYSHFDLHQKNVVFNNDAYFDYSRNRAIGNTYYEVFVSFADAGILDCVTMKHDDLVSIGATGRLLDLNRPECASIQEKYGDRFVYCEPYDEEYSEELVPVGIDVSDAPLLSRYHLYEDGCVLGLGAHTEHLDAVETFLDYIFEEAS